MIVIVVFPDHTHLLFLNKFYGTNLAHFLCGSRQKDVLIV